ncbi:MAG: transcriptional regulator [bacterium]|nr:transcriptional regulator [bacterium]
MATSLEKVSRIWPTVQDIFRVPHTEEDCERLVELLDNLVDEVGEDENHPLASLVETVGTLVESYETHHIPEVEGSPIQALCVLMEMHGLKQSELPELGSQGVVSEILSGKRQLNLRQVNALSKRFNVSPAVFVDVSE